jgi:hypothetical protein
MVGIDREFNLRQLQRDRDAAYRRPWPMSRVTARRVVKEAMLEVGVVQVLCKRIR